MTLFSALTNALVQTRTAQKGGMALGRQERAAAESAAAKAAQEQEDALSKALLERRKVDLEERRVGLEGKRVGFESDRLGFEAQRAGADASKAKRDVETYEYDVTQRPAGEAKARAELEQTRAATAASRAQAAKAMRDAAEPYKQEGGEGKMIPPVPLRNMIENNKAIGGIDAALDLLDPTKKGAAPQALGMTNAFGGAYVKNKFGRATPEEIGTRAAIANIGSAIIHDRSGAAVTVSEFPRLIPFVPSVNDTPAEAREKLRRLRIEMQDEAALYEANYGPENGFKPFRGISRTPAPAAAPAAPARAAAPLVAPRKPGESPADYIKRTGGRT